MPAKLHDFSGVGGICHIAVQCFVLQFASTESGKIDGNSPSLTGLRQIGLCPAETEELVVTFSIAVQ